MLWREIQKNNFTKLDLLLDFLQMSEENRSVFLKKHSFVLNLPLRIAQKIEKNNPQDPLLLQFIPTVAEANSGGVLDPVDDLKFQKSPIFLQKYKSRALIVTTSACAMHCRYCFRKNYPYQSSTFENELLLIQQDPTLDEILLSGGDPLSLGDTQLFALLENLEAISHLKRIRIHSRFLIGIPERMHEGFFKKLKSLKKQIIFVIHVNHKNELDDEILQTCQKLLECKIPVLSQTVLLKGVNDNKEALFNLFDTLINYGIIPYYLHQFDPVLGSMHFEVPVSKGLELIQELRKELPGYAVPTYVQEIPGKLSKTPLM